MDASLERSLDDVVECLRRRRELHRQGCSLLIGAGCSVTAGIETAAGFVRLIEQHYPSRFARAASTMASGRPGYPQCMDELARGEQRDLINHQVSRARINWAHMAIAQLIGNGYVDRVLTTNFDPLVLRACAMLGEFPAVYDFAVSQSFRPGELPDKAVFHLHGQSTGFVLMNTQEDVDAHSTRLGPLFEHVGQARPWIVVGYSGDNDPVFDHLAAVERFDFGLYWVCFKDEEPKAHIRDKLLQPKKDAFFIRGHDADGFFVSLARELDCFPPEFVERPFSFLKGSLSTLTEFTLPSGDTEIDVLHQARERIDQAIAHYEDSRREVPAPEHLEALELAATSLLMAGKHQDLDRLAEKLGDRMSPAIRDVLAWSAIEQGNTLAAQAKSKSGEAADALFKQAGEKYAAALAIKPDFHEALSNWGLALADQAETRSGEAADALFQAAGEKYAAALEIEPDFHVALNNWGYSLLSWSLHKDGREAADMLDQAEAKLLAAEALAPGSGSYILACLAARRGDATACERWLRQALDHGVLPAKAHLLTDPDLATVRNQDWFRVFLEDLP